MKVPFQLHANWVAETQAFLAVEQVSNYLDSVADFLLTDPTALADFKRQVATMPRVAVAIDLEAVLIKVVFNPEFVRTLKHHVEQSLGDKKPESMFDAFDLSTRISGGMNKAKILNLKTSNGFDEVLKNTFGKAKDRMVNNLANPHPIETFSLESVIVAGRRSRTTQVFVFNSNPERYVVAIAPTRRGKNRERMYSDITAYVMCQTQNAYTQENGMVFTDN